VESWSDVGQNIVLPGKRVRFDFHFLHGGRSWQQKRNQWDGGWVGGWEASSMRLSQSTSPKCSIAHQPQDQAANLRPRKMAYRACPLIKLWQINDSRDSDSRTTPSLRSPLPLNLPG
jgi:hypothetical protein